MGSLLFIIFIIILIFTWEKIINEIRNLFKYTPKHFNNNNIYSNKPLMTKYEKYFYDVLIELKEELNIEVMPQVNLASIIKKENNSKYRSELFRNIDFGIFTKDYEKLILLIEINDKTHNYNNRKIRDIKVDTILKNAKIKLIKFYSNYPNTKNYIKNRIKDEINTFINNN